MHICDVRKIIVLFCDYSYTKVFAYEQLNRNMKKVKQLVMWWNSGSFFSFLKCDCNII